MHARVFSILAASMLSMVAATAGELTGYISAEGDLFFHDPLYAHQEDQDFSAFAQAEYYQTWGSHSSVAFVPFGRIDAADPDRTHADIRELNYVYRQDNWYTRLGIGKVFWGATEFVHLIDIINQTDLIEDIDQEEKLGQPMAEFSISPSWGRVEFFLLPYFRERTFPSEKGRLRPETPIDTDAAFYQNTSGQRNMDIAVRYSRTISTADLGIYFFHGTNREPWLVPADVLDPNDTGPSRLIPFYEQMNQIGVDAQWVRGNWLWKFEGFYREGTVDDFFAATSGGEYTFFGVAGSNTDLGLLAEYAYDGRNNDAALFQNDLFVGLRLAPNDAAGTQVLAGFGQDLDGPENAVRIEASRRIGSQFKLSLEAWLFLNSEPGSVQYDLRDDDFARLTLSYFF